MTPSADARSTVPSPGTSDRSNSVSGTCFMHTTTFTVGPSSVVSVVALSSEWPLLEGIVRLVGAPHVTQGIGDFAAGGPPLKRIPQGGQDVAGSGGGPAQLAERPPDGRVVALGAQYGEALALIGLDLG